MKVRLSEVFRGTPSKLPTFSGNISGITPFLPGSSAGTFGVPGFPILIDVDSGQPVPSDPFNMHARGLTDGAAMMIIGARGTGKTTASIAYGVCLAGRDAAGRKMHIEAPILRRDDGVAELGKFVRALDSEPIPLAGAGLNIFIPSLLDEANALDLLVKSLEYQWKRPLTVDEHNGLAAGFAVMYRNDEARKVACPSVLFSILDSFNERDVELQESHVRSTLETLAENNEFVRRRLAMQAESIATADTVAGAHEAAKLFKRIMEMSLIGDNYSLADAMQQRVFAPEYVGLTDAEVVMAQSYIWRVKAIAEQKNDPRFSFNVMINDEDYKMCRILPYAQGKHDFLKALRGSRCCVFTLTHRFSDYKTVGSKEVRELSLNMIADHSSFLVAKQPMSEVKSLVKHADFTRAEAIESTQLGRYEWLYKVRGYECRKVKLNVTSGILDMSYSTASADKMYIPDEEE